MTSTRLKTVCFLEYLRDHDYDLLSLDEMLDPRRALKAKPHRAGQEFHATLFMVSNNAGCQGRLSFDQLREMDAAGFRVEDHSKTHDAARTVGSRAQQAEEYGSSKTALESMLGRPVQFAAYPYGRYNGETTAVMRELGYKAAFVIGEKVADLSGDPYLLTRFAVTNKADFMHALCEGLSAALGKAPKECGPSNLKTAE